MLIALVVLLAFIVAGTALYLITKPNTPPPTVVSYQPAPTVRPAYSQQPVQVNVNATPSYPQPSLQSPYNRPGYGAPAYQQPVYDAYGRPFGHPYYGQPNGYGGLYQGDNGFLESMLIAEATDSTMVGALAGGNLMGAIIGEEIAEERREERREERWDQPQTVYVESAPTVIYEQPAPSYDPSPSYDSSSSSSWDSSSSSDSSSSWSDSSSSSSDWSSGGSDSSNW